jgi:uncharacterized protein YidB (DUF937 family)
MGLLDELQGQMSGAMSANTANHAGGIMALIQNYPGGIGGLIQEFQNKGLGGVMSSWISTGQNLPISAEQIQHVLGSGLVQTLATKMGVSPDHASSSLAQFLPSIIDKLTPNGQVPTQAGLMDMGGDLLKAFNQQ